MRGKVITVIVLIAILGFLVGALYRGLPQEPVDFVVDEIPVETSRIIEYGATPVFSENLRFNHNDISYYVDPDCPADSRARMEAAMEIFADKIAIVSFYETLSGEPDIDINCSMSEIKLGENYYAAGEGGPVEIINTSLFKTIRKGMVTLYKKIECDYPIVELHELLHVFGFDHSPNPKSIMYNTSACDQRMTSDIILLMQKLYSIKPRPDLRISDIKATKHGGYLDFNITVLNEGLIDAHDVSFTLIADGKEVDEIEMGEIGIGFGRTLKAANIKLPSRSVDEIELVVDFDDLIDEVNEDNNRVRLSVGD